MRGDRNVRGSSWRLDNPFSLNSARGRITFNEVNKAGQHADTHWFEAITDMAATHLGQWQPAHPNGRPNIKTHKICLKFHLFFITWGCSKDQG